MELQNPNGITQNVIILCAIIFGLKRCPRHMIGMDPYLMVPLLDVQLGKVPGSLDIIQKFVYPWQVVAVFDLDVV